MTLEPGLRGATWGQVEGLLARGWSSGVLQDALQMLAEGVTSRVGFAVATIQVLRSTDEFETVAVAGSPEASAQLLGTFRPRSSFEHDLALAEDWGSLRFVSHDRLAPEEDDLGWVPDLVPVAGPNAWHPLDLLFAPLHGESGKVIGSLCVDLPTDGLRPGPERRRELARYVVQCARAVDALLQRDRLTERVRLADAAREVVRAASSQFTPARIVAECEEQLRRTFDARGMWIQALDDFGDGPAALHTPVGMEVHLDEDLSRIAVAAARRGWQEQRVGIVSPSRAPTSLVTVEQHARIQAFLSGLGLSSVMFVPLGAGPECLGNLVLARRDGDPAWSDVECAAALEIGHDLGRALLNARLFEQERRLSEELKALDGYKSQLLATVSHELKNPLTGIVGHLELLEGADVGEAGPSIAAVHRNTLRIRRLVDDLLLLARSSDPGRRAQREPVDLREVVEDAVELLSVQATVGGLEIVVVAPDTPVCTSGDPTDLERICANLLGNAVKYSPDGGTITLTLDHGPEPDTVTLVCEDQGIGIAPEEQEHLWTEFFRSSDPAAEKQVGTGLGLAIVARIVERHGGSIDVSSELGRGSRFRVTLPAC
ncbi:sensor histidine kinase [Nocardioides donggukensis]|uniref:histidine kinase n=1 Tax=Nocardioides donggukensis TaxID=2774019 RepID=A0A927K3H0_9ACTN|nr:HAMP domain-containing sensor histidine kinase [Nocardioides donggukensis]MBD8868280.1 HAMP domain-containing histidine kinase [Nocardioides donggukensis]